MKLKRTNFNVDLNGPTNLCCPRLTLLNTIFWSSDTPKLPFWEGRTTGFTMKIKHDKAHSPCLGSFQG